MTDLPAALTHEAEATTPGLSQTTDDDHFQDRPAGRTRHRGPGWIARGVRRWRRRAAYRLIRTADHARDAGDFLRAAARYRRALALYPRRPDIRVQLAHMLKELTLFGEAEAAYRQALAQSPEDGDIHLQLGHLLKLQGRMDDAAAAYSAAFRLLPGANAAAAELHALGVPPTIGEAGRPILALADERIREGDQLRDAGRYAEAAVAYGEALVCAPARTDIRIQHGNMLKDAGRLAEAEPAYRAALAQSPDNADAALQLGHLLKLQGRRAEALAAYRRAIEKQPSLDAAWVELFFSGSSPTIQREFFDRRAALGGVEALLAMTEEVARLHGAITQLAARLPDLCAQIAFPISAYDRFRRVYAVPPPPPATAEPGFAVILGADAVELETLYAQLASLRAQTYRNWQLFVIGSAAAPRRAVRRAAASDPRIRWIETPAGEVTAAERRVAQTVTADWLVLPAAGARLDRQALAWCAAGIAAGDAAAFVTDEEVITSPADGERRLLPQLRQVVDYDTLLEINPFGDTIIIARTAYRAAADHLLTGSLAAARSSLLLRLAEGGQVGHIPLTLVALDPPCVPASERAPPNADSMVRGAAHAEAVRAYLADGVLAGRAQIAADAGHAPLTIAWQPRQPEQMLQVVIPTRDNGSDLRDFVVSLRRRAAAPQALQVLVVDNASESDETRRILAQLGAEDGNQIIRIDEPFNWSRLNNRAASLSEAPLLAFANDDMVMLSDGWDRQLRGLLERPEIGAVGARLIYPDDTLQHAGVLFGWPDITVHDGRHEALASPGPGHRWQVSRAVSAVTGAFIAMRRDAFAASGGFDEENLPVGFGDIDLALKLRALGLKILWTPHITLRHFESKSRGLDHLDPEKRVRYDAEGGLMRARWGPVLDIDPSVNPAWHAATLPFRLISAPQQERLMRHIRLCASANPWLPERGAAAPAAGGP